MVDAVITWVDGADPAHSEKRTRYAHDSKMRGTEEEGLLSTRFQSLDEVRYCICLIRKNAPWIDTIHLLTDDQCPAWLDEAEQQRLNVVIVDHRQIFTGFEQYLPTFNSTSIESLLHRIPKLSDRFVYFNDDFFLIQPTKLSDFFDGDIPKIRGKPFLRHKPLRKLFPWINPRSAIPTIGMVGIRLGMWHELPRYILNMVITSHAPYPILKRDFAVMMEANDRTEKNIRYRFRNQSQFRPVALYATLGRRKRQVRVVDPDGLYLAPKLDITPETVLAEAATGMKNHLCIQSLDMFGADIQKAILNYLDEAVA